MPELKDTLQDRVSTLENEIRDLKELVERLITKSQWSQDITCKQRDLL